MNVIEFAEKRLQEEIHQNDLGVLVQRHAHALGIGARLNDAVESIGRPVQHGADGFLIHSVAVRDQKTEHGFTPLQQ